MDKTKSLKVCALVFFVVSVVLSVAMPRVAAYPSATIRSCNVGGELTEEFGLGDVVYACGEGYNAFEFVTIYVVPNNGPYSKDSSLCSADAQADLSGILDAGVPVALGTLPAGEYDMWVDRDGDGRCTLPIEPVWYFCARGGFFVIPEYWLGTILGLIGCFAAFGVMRVSKHRGQ